METFIKQIDNILTSTECSDFLIAFKKADALKETDEVNFQGEQAEYMHLDRIEELKDFDIKVRRIAQEEVDRYFKTLKYMSPSYYLENSMLLKLEANKSLPLHYDRELSDDNLRRNFLVLIYLQDLEQGGELYFPAQSTKVIPKPGRMVIVPTFYTHPHMVLPSGEERYTYRVNFFIKDDTDETRRY